MFYKELSSNSIEKQLDGSQLENCLTMGLKKNISTTLLTK